MRNVACAIPAQICVALEHRQLTMRFNVRMITYTICVAMAFLAIGDPSLADETAEEREHECAGLSSMAPDALAAALTDLALPDRTSPAGIYESKKEIGVLSKWTKDPRILVLGEGPVPPRFLEIIQKFADDLRRLGYSDTFVKVDFSGSETPGGGDLVVALTPRLRGFRKQASAAYYNQLVTSYGSEEALATAFDRHMRNLDAGFVDVMGDGASNVHRVIVALDTIGPPAIRDPQLFELLTTAMNPNPGNLLSSDLMYAKSWQTQIYYLLRWTAMAELYLSLLRNSNVRSGVERSEFRDTVAVLLASNRTLQESMANLGC